MAAVVAVAPLTDVSAWARGRGLEIVLLILGTLLLARFTKWSGDRITKRIDAASTGGDVLVRSEAAKHRHAIAQVLVWLGIALLWGVTAVLVLGRLGIPVASLVAAGGGSYWRRTCASWPTSSPGWLPA